MGKDKQVLPSVKRVTNPLVFFCMVGLLANFLANYIPAIVQVTWLNNTLNHIGAASLGIRLIAVVASLNIATLKKN